MVEWINNYNEQKNDFNENEYAFQTLTRYGKPKTMAWSVVSLVVGIISVVCCCFGWSGIVLGAFAVVSSMLSRRTLGYFDGMSIAGLVLGIFGLVFGGMLIIATLSIPEEFWEEYYKQLEDIYSGAEGGDF